MGRVDFFDLKIDNTKGYFYAGQEVRGSVLVAVSEALQIQGLVVYLKGFSNTQWVNKTSDKIYETNEVYVNDRVEIGREYLQKVSDGELLREGNHTLPFVFNIPQNIPSTYDYMETQAGYDTCGFTRYTCGAVIQTSSQSCLPMMGSVEPHSEYQCENNLQIFTIVPYGCFPGAAAGQRKEGVIEITGFLGATKGQIIIQTALPKSEFGLGESMPIGIVIANQTKTKFKGLKLMLMQCALLKARSRYENVEDQKEVVRCIESTVLPVVNPGKNESFTAQITVPLIPPTQTSGLIQIHYLLKLWEEKDNFELNMPIIIVTPI